MVRSIPLAVLVTLVLSSCVTTADFDSAQAQTVGSLDDLSRRIDRIEKNIEDLRTSVDQATDERTDPLELRKMEFIIEHINPGYWKGGHDRELFFSFYLRFLPADLHPELLRAITVWDNDRNLSWDVDPGEYSRLQAGDLGGYMRNFNTVYSSNGTAMTAGTYSFDVSYAGEYYRYDFDLGPYIPGDYIYSANYRGKIEKGWFRALEQATIVTFDETADGYEVEFTLDDPRVETFYLAFYDKDKNYLGSTEDYINSYSGEIAPGLNKGESFDTGGGINHVKVGLDDIDLDEGDTKHIDKVFVMASTVLDRSGSPDEVILRSISDFLELKRLPAGS